MYNINCGSLYIYTHTHLQYHTHIYSIIHTFTVLYTHLQYNTHIYSIIHTFTVLYTHSQYQPFNTVRSQKTSPPGPDPSNNVCLQPRLSPLSPLIAPWFWVLRFPWTGRRTGSVWRSCRPSCGGAASRACSSCC